MGTTQILSDNYVLLQAIYSHYFPDSDEMTKRVRTKDNDKLNRLESFLKKPMQELGGPQVFSGERYFLVLNEKRNKIRLEVFSYPLIILDGKGYAPKTTELYQFLDSLPKSRTVPVSRTFKKIRSRLQMAPALA